MSIDERTDVMSVVMAIKMERKTVFNALYLYVVIYACEKILDFI